MNPGVPVAVRNIDVAVRRNRGSRRMIEGLLPAGLMALAKRQDRLSLHVESDDLMRVTIDHPDAIARIDGNAVRIEDRALAVASDKGAVRCENKHWRIASAQQMNVTLGVDRDLANTRGRQILREPAEVSLYPVAPARQHNSADLSRSKGNRSGVRHRACSK